jgi:DNA-binding protein YbaB
MTCGGLTEAKAIIKDVFVNQGLEPEDQRRLETVVVLAVNDADNRLCNCVV